MSTKIFEEKPAAAPAAGMGDAKAKIEKQARQLAYDTRYQVKKEIGDKKVDPKTMGRLLLQRLQKSSAIPAVKMRAKQMLLGEEYIESSKELAVECVANAMFKVFVEGNDSEPSEIQLNYLKELAENPDKKYKVRVTDKKTGNAYVRYATRDKITQLRANPNISSVEMTEYGEPREGERSRGEATAKAKSGKGLDPVGKEDADVDNDGKKNDPNDKYLMRRRKAIGNAIATRKESLDPVGKEDDDIDNDGKKNTKSDKYLKHRRNVRGSAIATRKEEFIADAIDSSNKKITGKGVDNYSGGKDAVVKVFPNDTSDKVDRFGQSGSMSTGIMAGYDMEGDVLSEMAKSKAQQRFIEMLQEKKMTKEAKKKEKKLKAKYDASDMKANMIKQYGEKKGKEVYFAKIRGEAVKEAASCDDGNEDKRDQYAKKEIIKNKIRAALGVKNPIVMVASEETIGEAGDEPLEYLPPQIYGDYRGLDRSGKPTKMGGDFQPGGKYGPPKSAPLKQAKATPKSKTA